MTHEEFKLTLLLCGLQHQANPPSAWDRFVHAEFDVTVNVSYAFIQSPYEHCSSFAINGNRHYGRSFKETAKCLISFLEIEQEMRDNNGLHTIEIGDDVTGV